MKVGHWIGVAAVGLLLACFGVFGWVTLRAADRPGEAVPSFHVAQDVEQDEELSPVSLAADVAPPEAIEVVPETTLPSAAEQDERVDLEAVPLEAQVWGRVTSTDGTPIADATVSWSAWNPEFMSYVLASTIIPDAEVEAHTVQTVTDDRGRFRLDEVPPLDSNEPSFLWISHASHLAHSIEFGPEEGARDEPLDVQLELATESMEVRVLRSGLPIGEAQVSQRAAFPSGSHAAYEGGVHAERAPLLFLRQDFTDGGGSTRLAPANHRHSLSASIDDLQSVSWIGESKPLIVLSLEPVFTLRGHVDFPLKFEDEWGFPQVKVTAHRGPFVDEVGALPVREDGSIGPSSLPVLKAESYSIRLEGGQFEAEERLIPTPSAGDEVDAQFEGRLGGSLWFQALDRNEAVVPTAQVRASWTSEQGKVFEQITKARDDGYVLMMGLPSGVVSCEMTAPGYVRVNFGGIEIPEADPTVHEAVLHKGLVVEGTCLQGIDPATDFEVRYWTMPSGDPKNKIRVAGSEDGTFLIDDLVEANVAMEAISPTFGRSEVVIVDLSDPAQRSVILILRPALSMAGRVIHPFTGDPIQGAEVRVYNSSGNYEIDVIGAPVFTDHAGRFDVKRLRPGTNVIAIELEGFSSRELVVVARDENVNLGDIPLHRRQRLTAQLTLPPGEDPSLYALSAQGIGAIPRTSFGADGHLEIASASEGAYVFIVSSNRGTAEKRGSERFTLEAGKPWHLELNLAGGDRRIRVTTSGAMPGSNGVVRTAAVTYMDEQGREEFQTVRLDETGEGVVSGGIATGPVLVRVFATKGGRTGGTTYEILESDGEEVVIPVDLARSEVVMRVVDSEGQPMQGIEILPRATVTGGIVVGWQITDAKGEAYFVTLPPETDRVSLSSPSGGAIDKVPFEYPAEGEVVELIFDMGSSLRLLLHENGTAQSGGTCRLFSGEHGYRLTPSRASDEDGIVEFSNLGEGSYELHAAAPHCWTTIQDVDATPSGNEYSIELRRVGTLELAFASGATLAASDRPVYLQWLATGELVNDWIAAGRLPGHSSPLRTDSTGNVRLSGIPRGAYKWSCEGANGTVEVVAGEVTTESVQLP